MEYSTSDKQVKFFENFSLSIQPNKYGFNVCRKFAIPS